MSDLPEVPQRDSLEIEELDFIFKFPNRNSWRLYFTISTFLQVLFAEKRNVVCTNAGVWYVLGSRKGDEAHCGFSCFLIQFRVFKLPPPPPYSPPLGHVTHIGSILYPFSLKPLFTRALIISIWGQNCLLKVNCSIFSPKVIFCIFIPLMSLRRTQLLQKLSAAPSLHKSEHSQLYSSLLTLWSSFWSLALIPRFSAWPKQLFGPEPGSSIFTGNDTPIVLQICVSIRWEVVKVRPLQHPSLVSLSLILNYNTIFI